jgi:hypothetical protein
MHIMATGQDPLNLLADAHAALERIKSPTIQVGWKYVELPDAPFGVGIALSFGGTQIVVLSVMGGGNEDQLNITAGVLRDIQQERLTALELCNGMVRDNPAYPIFLHDAPIGWDILISTIYRIQLLLDTPTFFTTAVRALPIMADTVRPKFSEAGLGGRSFKWEMEDLSRLLMVSMV